MIFKKLILKGLRSLGYDIVPLKKKQKPEGDDFIFPFGKYSLICPAGHDFPSNFSFFPLYQRNLQRLAEFLAANTVDFSMIDVGANIGDTALLVNQNKTIPVLCVEGDDKFMPFLERNAQQQPGISICKSYLNDGNASVGSYEKQYQGGTMHLNKKETDPEFFFSTLDKVLENNKLFQKARLLKIDTDGHDVEVLKGAADYMALTKPVLFFEYDREYLENNGTDGPEALQWLATLGYDRALFYDNYGMLLTMVSLNEQDIIRLLHNYIQKKYSAFPYYDICLFHKRDEGLGKEFLQLEQGFYSQLGTSSSVSGLTTV
ncbi:MAG: FkbM family methyltransferase [Bacteroidetes bacterium]|nr:FkbM family methyltransferase [Bacteroidota bacterium]